jgi:hypothetical protein
MELSEVREFALALPEAHEQPHFQRTSFRVRGKIFATALPQSDQLNVLVDEPEVRAAIAAHPGFCEELWWGKRLAGVQVRLAAADPQAVKELLEEAWRMRAPKRAQVD